MTHVRRPSEKAPITIHKQFVDDFKPFLIKKVNQYMLLMKVGQGADAKVYLAEDCNSNKLYAIKVFSIESNSKSPTKTIPLEREIRIMRKTNHVYIVSLHEVLHSALKNSAYLVLEWASYGSLKRIIDKKIQLSEQTLSTIFFQIILGLEYLHSEGIVHQDIKPSNLLLFEGGIAKIADFGVGHSFQSANMCIGSPAYQSPDLFEDDSDTEGEEFVTDAAKGDIWSLGVTLFEACFFELPFIGENLYEIASNSRKNPLKFPQAISEDLKDLLSKMLNPSFRDRASLDQVKNHNFFKQASDKFELPIKPITPPHIDSSHSLVTITAEKCDTNFSFASMKMSSSWSGILNDIASKPHSPLFDLN